MTATRSLRQRLILGSTVFALAAAGVTIGTSALFISLQRSLDSEAQARSAEQHAADEIVTSVYGQILASYRQLQAPSDQNMERFDALGERTYERIRQYLFQEMPIAARFQVEAIKELHETLEVEAHHAFDLAARGDAVGARARVAELDVRASSLEAEVDRFMALREQERADAHEREVGRLRSILLGIAAIVTSLIVGALLFVAFIQRRVVRPLKHLSDAAGQLGGGNYDARISEQRHDELAAVALSFNTMASGIQSAHAEIALQNSELSSAIRDLKTAQQELLQQEKLSAIGLMLAGLAHELNNPLAGVLGTAQLLQSELSEHPDPMVRSIVEDLVTPLISESRRAGDLVRNLLQFSRKSNAQFQSVNVKTALDIAAGLRAYAFAQQAKELRVEIGETLFVAAEAQRLEHVAMNIMTNALDALRDTTGTTLVVRADSTEDGWVSLIFEDDGPGFREPERVFDAFYTTKPVGTGTGLGLTLVHRFVSESGGTVSAENVPSGGARLVIRLRAAEPPPRAEPDVAPTPEPEQTWVEAEPIPPAALTVLVVDDEPALREIQRRMLARLDISVLLAKDGAEAITILECERCDAVVTDIRMPGEIDGLALFAWIQRNKPELTERCIFVTGEIGEWANDSALAAHPERVISKPFTREDYVACVLALLETPAGT
jgi:signal transduction histidine kinase